MGALGGGVVFPRNHGDSTRGGRFVVWREIDEAGYSQLILSEIGGVGDDARSTQGAESARYGELVLGESGR